MRLLLLDIHAELSGADLGNLVEYRRRDVFVGLVFAVMEIVVSIQLPKLTFGLIDLGLRAFEDNHTSDFCYFLCLG